MDKNSMLKNKFHRFALSEEIISALSVLGYQEPTEIQEEVIPFALQYRDIVAKSQTGSGKTAAFAIPICELVSWEEHAPQALILEPTRELAVQVKEEIFNIGRYKRIKVPVVFGGLPVDKQALTLKQKSHIVVGTPGRIMDHIRKENLNLSNVRFLVIDEADLMLDMGFFDEVKEIMESLQDKCVKMLFSATLGEHLSALIEAYMHNPVQILRETDKQTAEQVRQEYVKVEKEDKYKLFLKILMNENPNNCIIFCATREMANTLFQKLKRNKIRCGVLHGELEQKERLQTIDDFRNGKFHYLIATDVAARGVDFSGITHVFNYDFPTGKETYVHRIGRTGRNGAFGIAISMIQPDEKRMQTNVEAFTGQEIHLYDKEIVDETPFWERQKEKVIIQKRKGAKFQKTITKLSIGGGKKSKMRAGDIVGTICSIEGMTDRDIGIIDIRDSLTYVEILNGKGQMVVKILQEKPIKGKLRKVRITKG